MRYGPDALVHAIVAQGVGRAHRVLLVTTPDRGVGVDDAEVRVHAHARDEEHLAGAVMRVEVAAVVGVAVARRHVPHRERHLVHGILVERHGHGDRFPLVVSALGVAQSRQSPRRHQRSAARDQTTRPRPVIRGRSRAVMSPGDASTTAGTAFTRRMAVALSPPVLWSPSVPMSWRSTV